MRKIHIVPAESALGQHRRDVGGERARAFARRIHHHAGKPRRQRQAAQRMPFRGDPATVECAELGEQRARFGERGLGRPIKKRE